MPAAEIKALTRKAKAAADQNATSCLHRERSKREQTEKKVGHDNGMTFLTCRLKSEDPKTIWRREVADWKVDPVYSKAKNNALHSGDPVCIPPQDSSQH